MSAPSSEAVWLQEVTALAKRIRGNVPTPREIAVDPSWRDQLNASIAFFDSYLPDLHHAAQELQQTRDACVAALSRCKAEFLA